MFKYIIFFLISTTASLVGGLCGIGGGVIIKPVLDATEIATVAVASFLSSFTVLSMSGYSVLKSFKNKLSNEIEMKIATPLAFGAAIGGVMGNVIFNQVKARIINPQRVGAVQAVCLGIITVGTIAYTLYKEKIKTHNVTNIFGCALIGLLLGIMSSFLGIGGGPINLIILFYFFSMSTKKAKQNSLYIIFFSQLANILTALLTHNIPQFEFLDLLLMVLGGLLGGMLAVKLGGQLKEKTVGKLFLLLMIIILVICIFNLIRYA